MRCAVWIVLLGMVIGCDAATESPQLIVLDAAAGVDGGVDSGALGVGGAGGEGGMGAGGEGGEGGMGAGGEGGEGGMGAGGEGGIGGEGGMGAGGEGGEGGGACVPRCADRACGADGCGGECGPACGDGAVCSDGACVRGECPAGTFECGGACVDLLTDKNHCGSCGHACVEEWPQEWTDRGFTPQDANIGPSCVDAECSFVCPDAETDVQHLFDDPQNCGACGNVCDTGAVNSQQDACRDAQCRCVVTHDEERVLGNTCDGYCQLAGYVNCDGGCCPTLEPGANRLAVADDLHHFVFDMAEPGGVRIAAECTRAYGWLVAYEDDGQVPEIVYWNCGERKLAPLLPAGRYGVIARSWDLPGDIVFERVALPVDFVAPGAQVRTASLRSATVTFRVPVADDYSVALRSAGGGCLGGGVVTLYDGDARVVDVMAERDCIRHLDARWEGRLSAGVYRVVATASASFNGDWRVAVERSGGAPEPGPEPGGINGAGTYDFEGFGVDGSATLELTFADAATYTLTTAGPGGQGCPGDTILAVRPRGGDIIALNDDAIGVCSRLSFDAAAGVTYEAVITGYDGGAVGDGVLVVGR